MTLKVGFDEATNLEALNVSSGIYPVFCLDIPALDDWHTVCKSLKLNNSINFPPLIGETGKGALMSNTQTVKGNWNQFKGKIKEKWGDVTDDDLERLRGQGDQLIGMIQEKTGVAREEIGNYVNSLTESASEFSKQAAETAREYRDIATERAQETAANVKASAERVAEQISDQAALGYEEAQRAVREKPAQSLAVCFGVGVLVGVVSGLVLRSR